MGDKKRKNKFSLQARYNHLADLYVAAFCTLMGIDGSDMFWVGDEKKIAFIGDYVVSYEDIRTCVDNNISFEDFAKWYDYCIETATKDCEATTPSLLNWVSLPEEPEDEWINI